MCRTEWEVALLRVAAVSVGALVGAVVGVVEGGADVDGSALSLLGAPFRGLEVFEGVGVVEGPEVSGLAVLGSDPEVGAVDRVVGVAEGEASDRLRFVLEDLELPGLRVVELVGVAVDAVGATVAVVAVSVLIYVN